MPNELKEECGIAGGALYDKDQNIVPYLHKMILNLQNRGQLSSGVSTFNEKRDHLISTYKDLGSVNEVFKTQNPAKTKEIYSKYSGDRGIAHTRYATCGVASRSDAHPFERVHGRKYKWFSLCFNGNLANYSELRRKLLEKKDYHMIHNNDTEIIMHNISKTIAELDPKDNHGPGLSDVFAKLSKSFDGAYNLGMLNADGKLMALRDPLGFKPLCYSKDDEKVLFASESVALDHCGVNNVKDLQPGQILINNGDETKVERFASSPKKAHCMFEWVYFANVSSTIDESSVYVARENLGKAMARSEPLDIDDSYVVIPVPDSSKPFGDSYAYELGLPSREGLVRNRYIGRTFIEGVNRQNKVEDKFTVLKEITKGKKVLLMDDSIVRGNTSKKLVDFIKKKGQAKEVHLRISCPPIVAPCFYGIDMSTIEELIAAKFHKEVGEDISDDACERFAANQGADSLIFQKINDIPKSLGFPASDLCMACLNGDYPTEAGCELYKKAQENHKNGISRRPYEC
ncbi:MAG: amidophosphoribosyltransferase [Nanoarchaeota archaeon]|nr:amidophosphoribosyltransferase [Nanoarchaeota archaeon]